MKQSSDVPKVWVVSIVSKDDLTTQVQFLMKENEDLKKRIGALENEVQGLKNNFAHYTQVAPQSQAESPSHGQTKAEAKPPSLPESQAEAQSHGQAKSQSMAELEQALRLDQAWLDEACPFKKAGNRSWRQMGENQGEKIPMNGKGLQVPRAYLHSIQNWAEAGQAIRLKAKIALELAKKEQAG